MAMLSSSSATQSPCLSCGTVKLSKLISSDNSKYGRKMSQSFRKMDLPRNLVFGAISENMVHRFSRFRRIPALAASTLSVIQTVDKLSTYLFRTEKGGHVKVIITRLKNGKFGVNIQVSSLEDNNDDMIMSWGIFRSDSSSLMPLNNGSGIFETRFTENYLNELSIELEFDASLAPFYVSFLLKCNCSGENVEIRSHRKTKFCFPVGLKSGKSTPLGLSYTHNGYINFALFSRTAKNVILCLFDDSSNEVPVLEIDLDPYVNKSGDIWHALLDSSMNFVSYGYRCRNEVDENEKSRVNSVLLDPYSKVIGENFLGKICKEPTFSWSGDVSPNLPMEKLMVYRLNVMDFTRDSSDETGGTFSAITEKLNHFKDLGVNAILLEPINPFDKLAGPYYPCHFFSPQSSYGPLMKEMVKAFHANGIEILLEVVFTQTSEKASLRKIDKPTYYSTENTLNCAHPVVQQLILDSLRHWVIEYHIDGFSFINASSMLLGFNGEILSRPPLIEAITFDPILSNTKLIADSTKEIQFPHWKKWAEMNGKFCSDVRNFLRGESLVSNLATRLCGSGDVFLNGRGPAFSFNFVSTSQGFSLVDLVSFSSVKESSWNCGEEGATKRKIVLETRLKQIRNYLFILYISLGVPVLNMGDECGQSSAGKGHRKPFNWKALQTGFAVQTIQFISFLSALKIKRSDFFQSSEFLKVENIDWYGPNLSPPNWDDPASKFLAMSLKVDRVDRDGEIPVTGDMFVAFNGGDGLVSVTLPRPRSGTGWVRLVDTGLSYPGFFSIEGKPVVEKVPGSFGYEMVAHSCVLLEARSVDD